MARPAAQAAVRRVRIDVSGAVQGVGFRPYVYRLATALELGGWVRNTPRGVQIEADGDQEALDALLDGLRAAPAPARVDAIDTDFLPSVGVAGFTVAASQPGAGPALPLPDLAVCADCLADIRDPAALQHRRRPALRPIAHGDGGFLDVPGLCRRIRRPRRPAVSPPGQRLPGLRAASEPVGRHRQGAGARLGGSGCRRGLPARRRYRGADGHRRFSAAGGWPR